MFFYIFFYILFEIDIPLSTKEIDKSLKSSNIFHNIKNMKKKLLKIFRYSMRIFVHQKIIKYF